MEQDQICPNCKEPLKSSFFGANKLLTSSQLIIVNSVDGNNYTALCNKCGDQIFEKAYQKIGNEIKQANIELRNLAVHLPIVTTHHPYNWEYVTLGMATAQTTTGTGVLTELTSSISDLFGGQSNRHNSKIKYGEFLCCEQLRAQAIAMEGNAIIGTDIDYAEVGGDKGMLMVCMSGTVIQLKNLEVLAEKAVGNIQKVTGVAKRLAVMTQAFDAYKG
jgi:uncharacterized protein YbjQ (UPF0145 family)